MSEQQNGNTSLEVVGEKRIDRVSRLSGHQWTRDQIELVKRTVAKGASDEELSLFLAVAKRSGLDPFARQIYCIRRWTPDGDEYVHVTGIDGFRTLAERTGKYMPGPRPVFTLDRDGNVVSAIATVNRWDDRSGRWVPVEAEAFFDEYAQRKKSGELTKKWAEAPRQMIAKCAEALAIRRAFPQDLSGLRAIDEVAEEDDEPRAAQPVAPPPPPETRRPRSSRAAAPSKPVNDVEDAELVADEEPKPNSPEDVGYRTGAAPAAKPETKAPPAVADQASQPPAAAGVPTSNRAPTSDMKTSAAAPAVAGGFVAGAQPAAAPRAGGPTEKGAAVIAEAQQKSAPAAGSKRDPAPDSPPPEAKAKIEEIRKGLAAPKADAPPADNFDEWAEDPGRPIDVVYEALVRAIDDGKKATTIPELERIMKQVNAAAARVPAMVEEGAVTKKERAAFATEYKRTREDLRSMWNALAAASGAAPATEPSEPPPTPPEEPTPTPPAEPTP